MCITVDEPMLEDHISKYFDQSLAHFFGVIAELLDLLRLVYFYTVDELHHNYALRTVFRVDFGDVKMWVILE